MKTLIQERIHAIKQWLSTPYALSLNFSDDPATQSFCLSRLQLLAHSDLLEQKVIRELGHAPWQASKRLLIIVSEQDPLGTLEAFTAAYLVGSAIRIKARRSYPWLIALRDFLGLDPADCEIADWESHDQNDESLFDDVDTVLLAGGDALIRHYRRVTPTSIRLIELGPKISAMAISGARLPALENILKDTGLFLQQVCSTPRFILLDTDLAANTLFTLLAPLLDTLPALPDNIALLQMMTAQELKWRNVLKSSSAQSVIYSPQSGWGITYQRQFNPQDWLPFGFQLVVAPLDESLKLAEQKWPGQLQTLGYHGTMLNLSQSSARFTRYCPIGQMHERPLLAPHDGFFMLSALVRFIQNDITENIVS